MMIIPDEKTNKQNVPKSTSAFHWSYIALPIAILLLSIILTAAFSLKLPAELAYHFKSDGSPDRWLSRSYIILAMLLPQLLLTLFASATTWGVARLNARFRPPGQTRIKPERIIGLMGNMVALPQIVLGFTMLDIFIYNSYRIHIMPLWLFVVIIMGVGSILLGIFFLQALRETWQATQ